MVKQIVQRLVYGALLAGAGCSELSDFRTGAGEVFRGVVVGNPPVDAGTGDGPGPFLLHGFTSGTRLELAFDPVAATAVDPGVVGTIETYLCEVETTECPARLRHPGPVSGARLRPIPGLSADLLSRYDFPGGDRVRNFIVRAPFRTMDVERHATVFVSLMRAGGVELRVIAPEGVTAEGQALPALFGVFLLERAAL